MSYLPDGRQNTLLSWSSQATLSTIFPLRIGRKKSPVGMTRLVVVYQATWNSCVLMIESVCAEMACERVSALRS